jgi:hypothetical protein
MSLAELNFTENILLAIRVVGAVVAAAIGWYACGPLTRLAYRVCMRRPTPGWLVPWGRLAGALSAALLAFFLLPIGGGSGLGLGAGLGGGRGQGPGEGGSVIASSKDKTRRPTAKSSGREVIEIEILGGRNYPGEGRYYLLGRTGTPKTLDELKEVLQKDRDRAEVHIILTEQSVPPSHGAVVRLRELLDGYRIPTVETVETETP